jgi:hypothetical protein
MANTDAPFGLKPVRLRDGRPYNGAYREYYITAADASGAIFIGDPVIKAGSANTTEVLGRMAGTVPTVTKASAGDGNAITGVVVGFAASDRDSLPYRAALTARIAYVADDPDLVFHIQDDGTGSLDATTVGLNAVLIYTVAGSTITGRSGVEMDGGGTDGPAADASNQLTILGLAPIPGNELADFAVWEVVINQHTEVTGAVGIA